MSDSKVIAVVGATGAQGGGVCRAILADPGGGFTVRALTRDPGSDAAKELATLGAEVVQADVNDETSLARAFEGAHGVYGVTFFWADFSAATETRHARNIATAAKEAGVHHTIWSTLEDTRVFLPISDDRMPVLQEKYNVPHFDAKGEANAIFTSLVPTTLLNTAFYWENFIYFGAGPARGADGKLALTMPMGSAKLPGIAVADIGKVAYAIYKAGDEYIGKTVSIAGEHLSGSELAAAFSRALGEEVVYNEVDPDTYRGFGFPGADEMGNMYQFKRDFESEYVGARNLETVRALNPELQTFDEWLAENKDRIPLG